MILTTTFDQHFPAASELKPIENQQPKLKSRHRLKVKFNYLIMMASRGLMGTIKFPRIISVTNINNAMKDRDGTHMQNPIRF